MKKALITGITGQDGSYLAEFLISKNYIVHGIKRRSSSFNTSRIDHIYEDTHAYNPKLFLHYGDLTDSTNIIKIIEKVQPDEIYNLGAQSHVAVSFESPEYTANCDALGTLRILEAVKLLGLAKKTKVYQSSTSELYGLVQEIPQNESTPFYPRSPYAVAKLYAYWIIVNYREAYDMFACNGILFNHESPRRGETFVTKKVVDFFKNYKKNKNSILELGNIYAKRDWGHAKDYVEGIWKILQHNKPDDFVISTGKMFSVKNFVNRVAKNFDLNIYWKGSGLKEKAFLKDTNKVLIRINKKYYRPTEVDALCGDFKKANKFLKWKPKILIDDLIEDMIKNDL